ncbi:unnamed protein product [Tenebrio molitor]|nr:unnamed protein product [Tenebrio molitor]
MIKTLPLLTLLAVSLLQKGSASCPNPAGGRLALNEIVTLAGCNFGICYEAGLYYLPCAGVYLNDPQCSTIPGDESKPYPDCCPTNSCNPD